MVYKLDHVSAAVASACVPDGWFNETENAWIITCDKKKNLNKEVSEENKGKSRNMINIVVCRYFTTRWRQRPSFGFHLETSWGDRRRWKWSHFHTEHWDRMNCRNECANFKGISGDKSCDRAQDCMWESGIKDKGLLFCGLLCVCSYFRCLGPPTGLGVVLNSTHESLSYQGFSISIGGSC